MTPPPSHACVNADPFWLDSLLLVRIDLLLCVRTLPYHAFNSMALVVQVEPNGKQALLMFDNARHYLADSGWLTFVERFDGFNLCVARQFAMNFDGCRAKVSDIQLEINEQFISLATGLPITGQRWSKNCKVEEVPWTLLFQSQKITSCDKGMLVTMLKQRWHDLVMIIKHFITCEGQYGFVFLHHLRFLMVFMGYQLNMPYYLHRSLFKMSKKYKILQDDSSLFHYGLVKLIVFCHLSLHGDCWSNFIARNGFEDPNPTQVDKPVVSEVKVVPPVPYHILLPKPLTDPPINLPHTVTKNAETVKPMSKKPKARFSMVVYFATLNPNTKDSYSSMLLVVSNSNFYDTETTSFEG
jgi:hypothetical protein